MGYDAKERAFLQIAANTSSHIFGRTSTSLPLVNSSPTLVNNNNHQLALLIYNQNTEGVRQYLNDNPTCDLTDMGGVTALECAISPKRTKKTISIEIIEILLDVAGNRSDEEFCNFLNIKNKEQRLNEKIIKLLLEKAANKLNEKDFHTLVNNNNGYCHNYLNDNVYHLNSETLDKIPKKLRLISVLTQIKYNIGEKNTPLQAEKISIKNRFHPTQQGKKIDLLNLCIDWLNTDDAANEEKLAIFYQLLPAICAIKRNPIGFFPPYSAKELPLLLRDYHLDSVPLSSSISFKQQDILRIKNLKDFTDLINKPLSVSDTPKNINGSTL